MTRDIKDIITDMREIVKPYVAQMLFNENFEGKGNTDKAEFETEFEILLTLAERGASVEPQEKVGEWIHKCINGDRFCECSVCRSQTYQVSQLYPFCPHCGAKMEVNKS